MSDVKVTTTCPLGAVCEKVKVNDAGEIIERIVCRWYIKMYGEDPATGDKIDKSDCAMAFLPIMMHENSKQQMNTGVAVDNLKNTMATTAESNMQLMVALASQQTNFLPTYQV